MKHVTLRQARENTGETAEVIAARIGIHRTTLHRIESGRQDPSRDIARRIFNAYKGRVSYIEIVDPEFANQIRGVA